MKEDELYEMAVELANLFGHKVLIDGDFEIHDKEGHFINSVESKELLDYLRKKINKESKE